MSASTAGLLRAASEIVGGNKALADRLGIGEALLSKFMADSCELPDALLLRAVDIILVERQSRLPPSGQPTALLEALEKPDNCGNGSGTKTRAGPA